MEIYGIEGSLHGWVKSSVTDVILKLRYDTIMLTPIVFVTSHDTWP